ncbi:MAG: hypothetical protein IPO40_08570 [Fibrobacteres bacterium]|nr:hypothetical protein [Fibrobacterota bacterium]
MHRLFVSAFVAAASVCAGVPNVLVPGQPARAEDMNKNFTYLDSAAASKAPQAAVGTLQLAVSGLQATKADQSALEEAIKLIAAKVGAADLDKALKGKADTATLRILSDLVSKKADAVQLNAKADTSAIRGFNESLAKKVDSDQLRVVKDSLARKADTASVRGLNEALAKKADVSWVNSQISASAPSGMLASGKNLSDLADKALARTNLGLGDLAVKGSLGAADVGALALSGGTLVGNLQLSGFANIGGENPFWAPSSATPLTVSGTDWVGGMVQTSSSSKGAGWAMVTPSNSNAYWGLQKRDEASPGTTPGGFVVEDGASTSALASRFPLSIAPGEAGGITLNRRVVITGETGIYPSFDKYPLNINGSIILQNMTGKQGNLALEFKGGPNYHSGSMDLIGVSNIGDMTDSLKIINGGGATLFSIANATGNAFFTGTIVGNLQGTVVATDIKASQVADYVFEPDYKLAPLSEVEAYTKTHKHLPEVPSASEIEKNGLDLAQMNLLLLKKVEELTLHTIELEKRMKAMESASRPQ